MTNQQLELLKRLNTAIYWVKIALGCSIAAAVFSAISLAIRLGWL